jgi:prepilin peptidase CpaA
MAATTALETMHAMDWVLVAMVVVCGFTDVVHNRIYNPVTYAGILSAIAVNGMGLGATAIGGQTMTLGDTLAGFLAGFLPLLALYAVGGVGGGDVKLMAAIGAMKGKMFVAYCMLYSLFLGALFGVVVVAVRGELGPILRRIWYTVWHTVVPGMGPTSYLDVRGPKINFGLAICFGTLITLLGQVVGRQLLDF